MKNNYLIIFLLSLNINFCKAQSNTVIAPYVNFLNKQELSAKEYILDLFKIHDIVVICERDHREIMQYDLILDIIKDKRFITGVGNIFTEIGVSNLNPALNTFLQTKNLSPEEQQKQILSFHRNLSFDAMWEKYNYTYLLQNLYNLNNKLLPKDAINLYPSDIPFDWQKADSINYKAGIMPLLVSRDSIIATQIIDQYNRLNGKHGGHKKALVILNYRHAFNNHFFTPDGRQISNATGFLFKHFGNRVTNVLLNSLGLDMRGNQPLLQKGIWDASFSATGNKSLGFNLINSPFGKDSFDLWPLKTAFTYQDVFAGYIFYQPIETQKLVCRHTRIFRLFFF